MKVLGVCGGNGVILYPFKHYLIGNIEPRSVFYTPNQIQWKLNFDVPFAKSLKEYWAFIHKPEMGQIDLIIGAPDCGHSSILSCSRIKKFTDPRENESLSLYLQTIKIFKPKIFVMENLPKLLETITEEDFKETFPDYHFIFHKKSVWEWGNSQKNRERLLIIGINNSNKRLDDYFNHVFRVKYHKTCKELESGLVYGEKGHIREDIGNTITLYAGFKIKLTEVRDRWLETNWTRWQVEGKRFSTAPGVYRNLSDGFPNTARKANRQFNSEGLMMSPRELARIQGVPDKFKIWVDEKRLGYCINKGRVTVTKCPPMEIAIWVKQVLKKAGLLKPRFL